MKLLVATSILFSILSASADAALTDINPQMRQRVNDLVMPFVEQHSMLWRFGFSRAMVPVKQPNLVLWTSAPATDVEERTFVPFNIGDLAAGAMPSYTGPTSGCYYADEDVAYVWLDAVFAVVKEPKTVDGIAALVDLPEMMEDETRCRARE